MKKLVKLLLCLGLLIGLVGCGSDNDDGDRVVVRLGVTGAYNDYWQPVIDRLAEDNIELRLVTFSEFSLPNRALSEGDIDMNAFQHYAFLEMEMTEFGYDLTVIGETIIAPLGLYSNRITDLSEFSDGDSIAIPSDITNMGRALKLLEDAGLIVVDPAVGFLGSVSDITHNPLNLDILPVEASMTPALLPDVTAAIINGGIAVSNGLYPITDAIFLETVDTVTNPNANRIINVLVVRTEDADNELFLRIISYFQTDEVAQLMEELYGGAFIPAWLQGGK